MADAQWPVLTLGHTTAVTPLLNAAGYIIYSESALSNDYMMSAREQFS